MNSLLLIIPCYNEESRLQLNEFKNFSLDLKNQWVHFLFANDGSKDKTSQMIEQFIEKENFQEKWFLFNNSKNTGKAGVIYNAYHWMKNKKKYDWYGYWDADLATPLEEIRNMLQIRDLFYPEKDVIFASRISRLGSSIQRRPLRHYLGRLFATLAHFILKVKSYDSQCGAKLFSTAMAEKAFNEVFISHWIFDIEIMLRVEEKSIFEYPLIKWTDIPGSKVKILQESIRILTDLYLIQKKYLQN